MLHTCTNPVLEILTVGRYAWQSRTLAVDARPYCALAYRLKGSGTLRCNGKEYTLSPETVLYMPQGVSYHHDYTDTDLLLFHFVTKENDPEPEVYRLKNPEEIARQFQKAVTCWEEKAPGYMGRTMSLLYRILGLLAENEAETRLPAHFLRAAAYLNEQFRRSDLRIDEVCREATISQTVFRQLFKAHYGKTPVEHLTELRLEHARNLIACGSGVDAAALESGFSDSKYFARVVKRHLGCTPRQLQMYGK